jgi:hypothetical protein
VLEGVPPEFFLTLAFAGPLPQGPATVHEAFMAGGPAARPRAPS